MTGYQNIARKYFADKGFEHVVLLSADGAHAHAVPALACLCVLLRRWCWRPGRAWAGADRHTLRTPPSRPCALPSSHPPCVACRAPSPGHPTPPPAGALEAAPAMGSADIILDLVSTGVTLRENNLKQLEGGMIMESQGALVANRRALLERPVSQPALGGQGGWCRLGGGGGGQGPRRWCCHGLGDAAEMQACCSPPCMPCRRHSPPSHVPPPPLPSFPPVLPRPAAGPAGDLPRAD